MEGNEVVVGAALIGVINLVQKQFPQVAGIYGVGLALLIGVILGVLGLYGLTVETGILLALGSSGVYKVASKMGGN